MTKKERPPEKDTRASTPRMTRRRFTKAGAVAPIVMTLGGRPVWGAECAASISGQQSGNGYLHQETPGSEGYRPSWWVVSLDRWPSELRELVGERTDDGSTPQVKSKEKNEKTIGTKQAEGTQPQNDVTVEVGGETYTGNYAAYCVAASLDTLTGCGKGKKESLYETLAAGNGDADAEAAAAILNALAYDYGYMPEAVADFVCNGHAEDVTCVLEGLNARSDSPTVRPLLSNVTFKNGQTHKVLGAYFNEETPQRLIIVIACS